MKAESAIGTTGWVATVHTAHFAPAASARQLVDSGAADPLVSFRMADARSADSREGKQQHMAEKSVVIRGGRLIDGTGRPPVNDSVIVIRAGRFSAIGRNGSVPIPMDAEIIDVSGKTVLPGFIDGHGHLEDFHGEHQVIT